MGRSDVSTLLTGTGAGAASQSNFRQLDDVFLQTQTRIWLGEVLNMRLDEQIHISDLLADGDLLSEVSKVVWNMLSAKYAELRHLKYKPTGSRKSSGRYMPYSNVDSFLVICNILGLNGIDLFSPSDVVEKRNIRKVCICIRALSKKLRSKQLNVPNFDMVTYSVVMPKDMVGGIRRSLETSKSSISSSSSYNNSYNDKKPIVKQRKLTEVCDRNYDSCSDGSDEAESKYIEEESYCSSTNKVNDSTAVNSDIENIAICSTQDDYENSTNQLQKTSYRKGVLENNLIHIDHVNFSLEHEESIGDSTYDNEAEGDFISDYLAFSDSVISGHEGNTPLLLDGEGNTLNFYRGMDSFRRSSDQALQDGHGKDIPDDMEDVEVSSTASMSSVLGRALNLEFDDHFDVDGYLIPDTPTAFLAGKDEGCFSNSQNQQIVTEGHSSQGHVNWDKGSVSERSIIDQNSDVPTNSHEHNQIMEEKCLCSTLDGSNDATSFLHSSETPNNEHDVNDMDNNLLEENASDGKDGTIAGLSKDKARQRPLLKTVRTVASGTAVVGLMYLLFHLSRRERGKSDDPSRKGVHQDKKFKGRDISIREREQGQFGSTARIYPAENLKFKS